MAALAVAAVHSRRGACRRVALGQGQRRPRLSGAEGVLGEATFESTYGTNADKSNAMGKCVSKWTQAEHQNRRGGGGVQGRAGRRGFAAAHGGKTFAQYYGSGKKGANAMNSCVAVEARGRVRGRQDRRS